MKEMLKIKSHYDRLPKGLPEVGKTFNEYAPDELKKISNMGIWESYNFKIGDRHEIKLTGVVNGVDLTGTWYAMIIGFNHNAEKEGKGITLQFANNTLTGGNNLAFVKYKMNGTNTNVGGWEKSPMRTKTCTEFYNALPKEWQSIIKSVTKYTDNTGGGNDNNPITATQDKIFILSEFEVHGNRVKANSHEKNFQKQYDYYKSGNSKIRYQHTSTESADSYWGRSPCFESQYAFTITAAEGKSEGGSAPTDYGFAPCFVI